MRSGLKMLLTVCLTAVLFGRAQDQAPRGTNRASDPCGIVREAIEEFGKIKPGMTRQEVEEHFKMDGGLVSREKTRYTYTKCKVATIKVDIKFSPVGRDEVEKDALPQSDIVKEVSKPYLEHPIAD
jgi:hypothetical protein